MGRANAAYYANHDPFGDFTTAPEISQIFGELIGAWAAVVWGLMGSPAAVILAEAGPGRGTLMADARRLTARVAPDFHTACQVHFIETSPRLRAEQAKRVPDAAWHDDLSSLPDGPLILVGNEFLDALPIRQFRISDGQWFERHVRGTAFLDIACPSPPALPADEADEQGILEQNEPAERFVAALGHRIASQGGVALLIDYGSAQNPGDSLQAIRGKRMAPPLEQAGEADLTALVDFGAVARAARRGGADVQGPVTQGAFLTALGLVPRAIKLAAGRPETEAAGIMAAARRLAEPTAMGRLFKAIAVTAPGFPPLPGFSA
ncbi:SAM-dependent methyltransferase [Acidisoma cellulosilytica]|uniref:SAM-dependent methyltransferase n=1 Tax=Acidisoma cellulosilyticum TaxID=2802395 RepID=A0A963Z013_9PROT|nr:SAM-dependent methyltransferase [Acidisoma cellulosilyticum]MCB8880029.1 SAM-dependent methyltransferase [Acidisoma cellulosilyticum]